MAAAFTVAGCSAGSSAVVQSAGPSGIRGTELASFGCPPKPTGTAAKVAPSSVVELTVCPTLAPSPFNKPDRAISLARDSTRFETLLTALSLPDQAAAKGELCPEYAELIAPIIAKTASTSLLVHVPSDGCGHMLPAVRTALSAVTGQ
ncbi:MAG TPA: hypothetical protein VHC43_07130 [Mycobacteriales bacterium]|nr:hypothetical protein [Mycobacteriales bacterium]